MSKFVAALTLAVAFVAPTTVAAATQPDVVVVMVDDLGYIADDRVIERLPNIHDLFVTNGLRFTQMYDETSWCCPARVNFLTGQHTHNTHVIDVTHPNVFDPTHTLATALHDAGYYTAMVGKYVNNAQLLTDRTPPGWDRMDMSVDKKGSGSTFYLDGTYAYIPGQWDVTIGSRSLDVAKNAPVDQPLFLEMTPRGPHHAFGSTQPFWKTWVAPDKVGDPRCAGIALFDPPSYTWTGSVGGFPLTNICEALLTVDDSVGQLREAMAARGRPTVWVFMGDNGMSYGQHGWPQKEVPWATRMTVYMSGAGVPTGTNDALLSNIDLGPTLAEMAGTSMPWADGHAFGFDGAGQDWLLEDFPSPGDVGFGAWWAIRDANWRLVVKPGHYTHLYNLTNDPWEMHNLSNPTQRARLRALYPW